MNRDPLDELGSISRYIAQFDFTSFELSAAQRAFLFAPLIQAGLIATEEFLFRKPDPTLQSLITEFGTEVNPDANFWQLSSLAFAYGNIGVMSLAFIS